MSRITINSDNTKILVCCHKKCDLPSNTTGILLPIQCGASLRAEDLGMQKDNRASEKSCDSISQKNASFCELTAIYWAWKNIKKIYPKLEYIGINHYRRYFSLKQKNLWDTNIIKPSSDIKSYTIDRKRLASILTKNQAVLAKALQFPFVVETQYSMSFVSDDIRTVERIVRERYSDYTEALEEVIIKGNRLAPYNMMIMRWEDFNNYCAWLFDILGEVERQIDITNYSPVQKRLFGHISERLLNVWAYKNLKKVKYLNVYFFVDGVKQYIADECVWFLRCWFAWAILKPHRKFSSWVIKLLQKFGFKKLEKSQDKKGINNV